MGDVETRMMAEIYREYDHTDLLAAYEAEHIVDSPEPSGVAGGESENV